MGASSKQAASPLLRLLKQYSIRRIDLAARAGCTVGTIAILCRLDPNEMSTMRIGTVARVAAALGVAPAELVPWLASCPRSGLLWERGFRRARPTRQVLED